MIRLTTILFILAVYHAAATAADSSESSIFDGKRVDEVWVNPGFYSHHFQDDKNLNNHNLGLGIEYRYSTVYAAIAGRFNNSEREQSSYFALLVQPFVVGGIRLGGVLGIVDGYPRANHGNWFPLIIPVASYEYKNIGVNVTFVPTIQDTVYGAIALQIKFKVY